VGVIGKRTWVIPEGYIPGDSVSAERALVSHEAACMLNPGDETADITIMLYFADAPPVGPYRVTVPARRTLHLRFNELSDPRPVPRDTDYASVIESSVPIVVQHTRLDSRNPSIALMTTLAYSDG